MAHLLKPRLGLYKSRNASEYLLSSYGVDPSTELPTATGVLRRIDEETMRRSGLDIVLEDLAHFSERPLSRSEESEMKADFFDAHAYIEIVLVAPATIRLVPMHRTSQVGFESATDEADSVMVSLPCTAEALINYIDDTITRCRDDRAARDARRRY